VDSLGRNRQLQGTPDIKFGQRSVLRLLQLKQRK
jgi:hypothetical protein